MEHDHPENTLTPEDAPEYSLGDSMPHGLEISGLVEELIELNKIHSEQELAQACVVAASAASASRFTALQVGILI